jgi:large subunit ribosomal protein L32
MGLPGKRLSSRRKKTRAAHHALKPTTLNVCTQCKKPALPHTACDFCGHYKGRNVLARATAKSKKAVTKTVKAESVVAEEKSVKQ